MIIVVIVMNMMPMSMMNREHHFRDQIRFLNTLMMIGRIKPASHKAQIKLDIVAQRVHPPNF